MTTLIERLRKTAFRGVSVWSDLQMEAADELERFQSSLIRLKMQLDQQREVHESELADRTAERDGLRAFIASNAWAITYQTIEQYRTALLRKIDGAQKDSP